jgi:outer membrane lipoprotein-sorting protein
MDFLLPAGLLLIVILVVIVVAQKEAVSNKKEAMEGILTYHRDFYPTQKIMGNNGDPGLAVAATFPQ